MKIDSFKDKLGGWVEILTPFIESDKCDKIYAKLKEDSKKKFTNSKDKQNDNQIWPLHTDTFKAFQLCPPDKLKLVVIGMEPYSGYYYDVKKPQADGLALSSSYHPTKMQPSLVEFWKGISGEYDLPYEEYYKTNNLAFLAEQGVLLTNRSLTVKNGKIGSHVGLWDSFWEFFFGELQSKFPNTPVMMLGKDAAVLKKYIFEMANPIWILDHPSFAARSYTSWDTQKAFENINGYLRTNKDCAIVWSHKLYEEVKEELKSDDPEIVRIAKLKSDTLLPF